MANEDIPMNGAATRGDPAEVRLPVVTGLDNIFPCSLLSCSSAAESCSVSLAGRDGL